MVDTDDTCASTHTLRCTIARGHDGKHTAFRTRVSWTGDVDATARLRLMVLQIAASEWGQTACVPEHIRHALRGRCAWPFPEAWPSWTWAELHDALSALSPLRPTPPETARLREPRKAYGRCDECQHLFSPSELDAERGDPTWGHACFGSFKGNRRKPGTARCESYRVPMVEVSPLRSTPQEGTTDDLTRIGELAVQPSPQHAAADREDS